MRLIYFILILYIAIVSSLTLTKIAYNLNQINDVVKVDIYTTIIKEAKFIGMDISTDALRFPSVARGGQSARRYINLSTDKNSFVVIEASGKVKDYVFTDDNNFILMAGESKEIEVKLQPPKDTPLGPASGKLTVVFYKPLK